ncbi:alpha/beta fold hydrolase [Variovorax sp. ZT4R33]|uniref:alpha/beta fold hydrolase n=1 Tax=Variovorax sp. ZT4R33 TaxID=3443743 RepID=UPI003F48075A
MKVQANGIDIEVEDSGGDGRPVVLLVMGLNMQLIAWPDNFVKGLVGAGFRVVRFDNRDAGLSTQFDDAGTRSLLWQGLRHRFGLPVQSAYTLQDMAEDAVGVLDALGIRRAHVVGASMGGMIAQRVAATAPERVASLVSLMSSSGARGLPGPRRDVVALMMRRPVRQDEASLVAHSMRLVRLIAGPYYPPDQAALRERLTHAFRRAYRPRGLMRQITAVAADTDRAKLLARIQCPTLVLHGDVDPLVPIACGQDTVRRIPGARFSAIPGMGHDLTPQITEILLSQMVPFLKTAEKGCSA